MGEAHSDRQRGNQNDDEQAKVVLKGAAKGEVSCQLLKILSPDELDVLGIRGPAIEGYAKRLQQGPYNEQPVKQNGGRKKRNDERVARGRFAAFQPFTLCLVMLSSLRTSSALASTRSQNCSGVNWPFSIAVRAFSNSVSNDGYQ